ncbi:MAG: PD-(D/E)XK nuclease superfamily protein [Candidatus Scalindua rubra]|uniref:PD-(D/E)XK nuclease superfamily protein n=1 Tax=Candidatus Scalindua rubra TaxID=1872076 RepID=A0A1E3XF81_9BACT|nr:MAG: PD-(D/E)XK nuclease superfamily protein [Candidatus Scalindua rubra]
MFRRCQRQYYFAYIAANHLAKKEYVRREAYLLKQVKQLSPWRGTVIHQGIKKFVIPYLEQRKSINWDNVKNKTIELVKKQLEFSRTRKFRELGITKANFDDEFCIIAEHENGNEIDEDVIDKVRVDICTCFDNLASQTEMISYLQGRKFYLPERFFSHQYENVRIHIAPDLILPRAYGCPSIIDWKVEQDYTHGHHKLQVALYAWVLCKENIFDVQKPEDIELYEVQLLNSDVICHDCSSTVFEELEDFMFQSIQEIRSLCGDHKYANQNIEDYEFARSPNSCLYCSFQKLCKELSNAKSFN